MPNTPRCVVFLLVLAAPSALAGQEPPLRAGGAELSLGGRVHTQLETTSVDGEAPSRLFIRRARIELEVRIDERVFGRVQPDFAGDEVALKDAYVGLRLAPSIEVLAGRSHRPFGLLEQTSSKRMLPVERGLRIRGLAAADAYSFANGLGYSDRDVGVKVRGAPAGAPLGLEYAAGVFRGPLHEAAGAQDSYQLAGRVAVRPAESVRVGAGWSSRHFAAGPGGTPDLERGHALEVDLEYGSFAPGFHLLAEASTGDVDPSSRATFRGIHAWMAWRTEPIGPSVHALEPLLRTSVSDADGAFAPGGTLLSPGLNLYLTPLNRIMLTYDLWFGADGSPDARSLKVMFQLAF